jgi:hypothetical protein
MAYTIPAANTFLPPRPNTKFEDPPAGASTLKIIEWQQAYYQDLAWRDNQVKVQDYQNTRPGPDKVPMQTWICVVYMDDAFYCFQPEDKQGTAVCKPLPSAGDR